MPCSSFDELAFSGKASEFPVTLKLNLSCRCTTARSTVRGAQLSAAFAPKVPYKDNSFSFVLHLADLFIITLSFLPQKRFFGTPKTHADVFKAKAENVNKR